MTNVQISHKGDATKPSQTWFSEKEEINRNYRGQARKARLMIADLTYGLALIEGELGAESVRENWGKHIDRLWRCIRTEDTLARGNVMAALRWAAMVYEEPRVAGGWKKPRTHEQIEFVKDANGVQHYLWVDRPFAEEAAQDGIDHVARFDPELAAKLSVADIARLIPIWLARRSNVGRRGKAECIDEALSKLVTQLGYGPISPDAMRRQRLAFEKPNL